MFSGFDSESVEMGRRRACVAPSQTQPTGAGVRAPELADARGRDDSLNGGNNVGIIILYIYKSL